MLALSAAAAMMLTTGPTANALDIVSQPDNSVSVSVPAVAGGSQLWLDIEAPGLTGADVVVKQTDSVVDLHTTAVGAGIILPYDGTATVLVGGTHDLSQPDVAITIADAQGSVLHSDHARLELQPLVISGDGPTVQPSPSETPSRTAPAKPSMPARPGLPKTGVLR